MSGFPDGGFLDTLTPQAASATFRAGPQAWDDFRGQANGAPTGPRNGATYTLSGASDPLSVPRVASNVLTFAPAAGGAGYAVTLLDLPCKRIGATFSLSAYTTANGSAVLGAFAQDITTTLPTVPDSPCHVAITATGWTYGVWTGNAMTTVLAETFATPLTPGTVYSAEVVIDRANSRAYVTLPDGTQRIVSHALIGSVQASYAFVEMYRQAATDSIASFVTMWADGRVDDHLPVSGWMQGTQRAVQALTYVGAPTYVGVPIALADIDANLHVSVVAPPSGKVLVELVGNLAMTAAARVLWAVRAGGTTLDTVSVVNQQYTGNLVASFVLTGLTPTSTYDLVWQHMSTVGGNVAVFQMDGPNGYAATMKVTPLSS